MIIKILKSPVFMGCTEITIPMHEVFKNNGVPTKVTNTFSRMKSKSMCDLLYWTQSYTRYDNSGCVVNIFRRRIALATDSSSLEVVYVVVLLSLS